MDGSFRLLGHGFLWDGVLHGVKVSGMATLDYTGTCQEGVYPDRANYFCSDEFHS